VEMLGVAHVTGCRPFILQDAIRRTLQPYEHRSSPCAHSFEKMRRSGRGVRPQTRGLNTTLSIRQECVLKCDDASTRYHENLPTASSCWKDMQPCGRA
jgi:hypothetical protein